MESRPEIKISLTQFEKVLEIAGIILFIIMWALTLLNYFKSPDTVPVHLIYLENRMVMAANLQFYSCQSFLQ